MFFLQIAFCLIKCQVILHSIMRPSLKITYMVEISPTFNVAKCEATVGKISYNSADYY